jgi:hypothetical protein
MRTPRTLLIPALLFLLMLLSAPCAGDLVGQVTFGGGAVWPQQEFASYSDPGPYFLVRGEARIPDFPAGAGWVDLSYTQFMCEKIDTEIEVDEYVFDVIQRTTQNCVSAHVGLQIGSSSSNAFFRPRVGAGLGVYHFWTALEIRQDEWPGGDDEFLRETVDSSTKFGWRGVAGADLYFAQSWGVSADFIYDEVWGFERVEGDDISEETATFYGFFLGVVIPF